MAERKGNSVERYYAAKEKKQKRKKVRVYFFLTVFSIAVLIILSLTVFFNIRSFSVKGNERYTEKQIIEASGIREGKNLFRLNKFKIADALETKLPYLGHVHIYRKLPTTLCFEVEETRAAFAAFQSGKYIILDDQMKVLETVTELPEGVAYLIGDTVKEPKAGYTAVFAGEGTDTVWQALIPVLRDNIGLDKISAVDLSDRYNLRLYYDHDRIKILLGNADELVQKIKMAQGAIEKNGLTETARIDVTNSGAAYYRILTEEERDDTLAMLKGETTAKDDKAYANTEEGSEQTEQQPTENSDENQDENQDENEEN